jgi:hypothetical protein
MVPFAFQAYDGTIMIRFVLRLIGLLSLALGFIFLVYDGTKSIADQRLYITKVGDVWLALHDASLAQLQPAVERISPWLWDPMLVRFLSAPSALVLVILGAILMVVGRKRRPLIGYGRD